MVAIIIFYGINLMGLRMSSHDTECFDDHQNRYDACADRALFFPANYADNTSAAQ